jgi:UDP-4-amino-4-deoxy-L-arabinose-oxoglutarate aminotransferase
MKVEFLKHNLGINELKSIKKVFDSIFLTGGPTTEKFEQEFAKYLGIKSVIGVSCGTSALYLALKAYKIGPGDEVILPALTFMSTANAIESVGARPIFVDVDRVTANVDPKLIIKKINKKTKAIIPVHLYGQMADMVAVKKIAKKYKLIIIEDSAQCVEGIRDGFKPGQLSHAACFSFHAIKNITCGEGGAIATNDQKIAGMLKKMRVQGMDRLLNKRYQDKKYTPWDLKTITGKFPFSEIQAALLLPQIKLLEPRLKIKNQLTKYYQKRLNNLTGIELLKTARKTKHAYTNFAILVNQKKRDDIIYQLKNNGIGVIVNFYPIVPLLTYYQKKYHHRAGSFPIAEEISKRVISLPLYPKLKKSEIDYVVKTLAKIVKS